MYVYISIYKHIDIYTHRYIWIVREYELPDGTPILLFPAAPRWRAAVAGRAFSDAAPDTH